jgi:hypothetical protein
MIGQLIEELQSLERNQDIQNKAPVLYVNVPDGNGNVLTLTLSLRWAQGKHKSLTHAMLLMVKAFRDGQIQSVCGRSNPRDESIATATLTDLDHRIKNIEALQG